MWFVSIIQQQYWFFRIFTICKLQKIIFKVILKNFHIGPSSFWTFSCWSVRCPFQKASIPLLTRKYIRWYKVTCSITTTYGVTLLDLGEVIDWGLVLLSPSILIGLCSVLQPVSSTLKMRCVLSWRLFWVNTVVSSL